MRRLVLTEGPARPRARQAAARLRRLPPSLTLFGERKSSRFWQGIGALR